VSAFIHGAQKTNKSQDVQPVRGRGQVVGLMEECSTVDVLQR